MSVTASPRTAIATVCLSGTLEDKLAAAASAGFDGVEIFEPDLVASPWSPAQVRDRCRDLGLSIDLYQPFRDFDSVDPAALAANLRRAEHKFDIMQELGTDLVLVCSSVSADAADDNSVIAEQLCELATRAHGRGLRVSYEALAWGRHVNTYERSWEIVRKADHPALGLCLDSFHILSRGSDPAGIRDIPGEKLFFLQLADAPLMHMDVLQWSRHYRLFPGQGAFDLPAFLEHVLVAGYAGPLSLEIFNDVFRQSSPTRAAVDALRSLLVLYEATNARMPAERQVELPLPPAQSLAGHAFVELAADDATRAELQDALSALGFAATGKHRTKPVELWQQGTAHVLLNSAPTEGASVGALGIGTADPAAAAGRAAALLAPVLPRTRGPAEADLASVAAPDGTAVFFCAAEDGSTGWLGDFDPVAEPSVSGGIDHIDHVALTQPFDNFDEATLFYRALLGLSMQRTGEVAAASGVIRNRAFSDPARTVRICVSVSALRRGDDGRPGVTGPQHVAFATDDIMTTVRAARENGLPVLDVPDNYFDDLGARFDLPEQFLADLRANEVLYDRDQQGEFLHFYTDVIGSRLFFEVVQRIGPYDGYGEPNAPVRMAAHLRTRKARSAAG